MISKPVKGEVIQRINTKRPRCSYEVMNPEYGKRTATVLMVLFLTSSAIAILPRLMNAYGYGVAPPGPTIEPWTLPPIIGLIVSVVVLIVLIIVAYNLHDRRQAGREALSSRT